LDTGFAGDEPEPAPLEQLTDALVTPRGARLGDPDQAQFLTDAYQLLFDSTTRLPSIQLMKIKLDVALTQWQAVDWTLPRTVHQALMLIQTEHTRGRRPADRSIIATTAPKRPKPQDRNTTFGNGVFTRMPAVLALAVQNLEDQYPGTARAAGIILDNARSREDGDPHGAVASLLNLGAETEWGAQRVKTLKTLLRRGIAFQIDEAQSGHDPMTILGALQLLMHDSALVFIQEKALHAPKLAAKLVAFDLRQISIRALRFYPDERKSTEKKLWLTDPFRASTEFLSAMGDVETILVMFGDGLVDIEEWREVTSHYRAGLDSLREMKHLLESHIHNQLVGDLIQAFEKAWARWHQKWYAWHVQSQSGLPSPPIKGILTVTIGHGQSILDTVKGLRTASQSGITRAMFNMGSNMGGKAMVSPKPEQAGEGGVKGPSRTNKEEPKVLSHFQLCARELRKEPGVKGSQCVAQFALKNGCREDRQTGQCAGLQHSYDNDEEGRKGLREKFQAVSRQEERERKKAGKE
jgi:hypothetical protein